MSADSEATVGTPPAPPLTNKVGADHFESSKHQLFDPNPPSHNCRQELPHNKHIVIDKSLTFPTYYDS
jgi:hypothetical protein